jgi:hypothetical protein
LKAPNPSHCGRLTLYQRWRTIGGGGFEQARRPFTGAAEWQNVNRTGRSP